MPGSRRAGEAAAVHQRLRARAEHLPAVGRRLRLADPSGGHRDHLEAVRPGPQVAVGTWRGAGSGWLGVQLTAELRAGLIGGEGKAGGRLAAAPDGMADERDPDARL